MLTETQVKKIFASVTVEAIGEGSESSPFWQIDEKTKTSVANFLKAKKLPVAETIVVEERESDGRKWIATGFRGIKAPKGSEDGDVFDTIALATATRSYGSVNKGDQVAMLIA